MTLLADFVKNLKYRDIPRFTQIRLKSSLLDMIGNIAAAHSTRNSDCIRTYAVAGYPAGDVKAHLLFDGRTVSPLGAAWAGGFCADSVDGHEGHFLSKGHAGATVIPAMLTLADAHKFEGKTLSGEEFLTILAVAYEVSLRSGVALMEYTTEYHASGAFSGLGVVAGGARMLNLSNECFAHALGIAEYFSPRCPMMRLVDHPTMLRDAHGAGAYAGLNALLMAQSGITGAPADLLMSDASQHHWQSLGSTWEIDNQYYKPWPVCRWAQPALTAITAMMELGDCVTPENIARVTVETFHESMRLQGHAPNNADEAQYGLAFPVAALLCKGKVGPTEVSELGVFDKDVQALAKRIEIIEASDLSERFPEEILSRVTLELKDGTTLESPVTQAKGDPSVPMTEAEIQEKFLQFTDGVLSASQQAAIIEEVDQLEERLDISRLLYLVRKIY